MMEELLAVFLASSMRLAMPLMLPAAASWSPSAPACSTSASKA